MRLSGLSNDVMRLICDRLEIYAIATLYGTNDRSLMRKLISRGVYPNASRSLYLEPLLTRFLCEHTALESYTTFFGDTETKGSFPLEGNAQSNIFILRLHPRQILGLHPSLLHLEITSNLLPDPTLSVGDRTFASIFPLLKSLAIRDARDYTIEVHHVIDQLIRCLPPQLEKLTLMSASSIVRIDQLPTSLTELNVLQGACFNALAAFPARHPTLALMRRLHAHTPNLRSLSTLIASSKLADAGPASLVEETLVILPHLHTLNLMGNENGTPSEAELEAIIRSAPSIQSFALAKISSEISFGKGDEGYEPLDSRSIKSFFPPTLTHLGLSTIVVNPSALRNLPSTLTSLTLYGCRMPWALKFGQIWDPVGIGSGGIDTFPDESTASSNDLQAQCWLELLPRTLERLEIHLTPLPIHVHRLPPQLHTLIIRTGSVVTYNRFGAGDPTPPPVDENYKSMLSWLPRLTSLSMSQPKLSKADALTLPTSLKSLHCTLTPGWNQDDIKDLLDHLPDCITHVNEASRLWITDSPMTEDTPDVGQEKHNDSNLTFTEASYIERRLSHLPRRLVAAWSLSFPNPQAEEDVARGFGAENNRVPPNLRPLHLLPNAGIDTALFASTASWTSLGKMKVMSADRLISLLESQPTLTRLHDAAEGPIERGTFSWASSTAVYVSRLQHLTSIDLPSLASSIPPFADLPASLTSMVVANRLSSFIERPENVFDEWAKIYRPSAMNEPKPSVMGSFGRIGTFHPTKGEPESIEREIASFKVSNLPRGLKRLLVSCCRIRPESDGDWPKGLTDLSFFSNGWEDVQIFNLSDRFEQEIKIHAYGHVLVYGNQPLPKEGESTVITAEVDISASMDTQQIRKPFSVPSFDTVDFPTLPSLLEAQFLERNISISHFLLPSLLVVAAPTLQSLSYVAPEAGKFKVKYHDHQEATIQKGRPAQLIRHMINLDKAKVLVTIEEALTPERLTPFRSLTSFTCLAAVSWDQIAWLPETLRNLSVCLVSYPSASVDPFIRCPRFLETLKLDCSTDVLLTADGILHLPPSLTEFECNLLIFSPQLIPEWPQGITSTLFFGHEIWSDVDLLALATHIGPKLERITVSQCLLSGALLPLDSVTEVSLPSMIEATNLRLGKKFQISWSKLSTPLALFALDSSRKALEGFSDNKDDLYSLSNLNMEAPRGVLSLDLHLAPFSIEHGLPGSAMPPMLTKLNIRSYSAITVREASSLPHTLLHLTFQFTSLKPSLADGIWAALPRGLESISIEVLANEHMHTAMTYDRPVSMPIFLLKTPLFRCVQPPYDQSSYDNDSNPASGRLDRLTGLPTQNLKTLSLRAFLLGPRCYDALGPVLHELHCTDIADDEGKAASARLRSPKLQIFLSSPGFLAKPIESSISFVVAPDNDSDPAKTSSCTFDSTSDGLRAFQAWKRVRDQTDQSVSGLCEPREYRLT